MLEGKGIQPVKCAEIRAGLVLCMAFFGGALSCWAVGDESPYTTDIQPHIIVVDIGIGYRGLALLPDVDTTIWAYFGGG